MGWITTEGTEVPDDLLKWLTGLNWRVDCTPEITPGLTSDTATLGFLGKVAGSWGPPRFWRFPLVSSKIPNKAVSLPEDADVATSALVRSSVPMYRNSELCPKMGCGRVGYFKRMHMCCDVHGAFHP